MRTSRRRAHSVLRVLGVLVLLAIIVASVTYVVLTRTRYGGNAVDWAARQVVSIVERSIVPEVGFERFEYEAPRTLRFLGLTLTSPDGVRVGEAASVEVVLTKTPRFGEPIYIESVGVEGGLVELIETRDAEDRIGFAGLVPFVKREDAPVDRQRPAQGFEVQRRLSDVLRMRRVTLEDCGLRFTPMSGQAPMRLTGVSTTLSLEPVDEGGRLWHTFDLDLERGDALRAKLVGKFDLDLLELDLAPSSVEVNLTDEPARELPPSIQAFLMKHEARGDLRLDLSGVVPVREIAAARATGSIELRDFRAVFDEYQLPIDSATVALELRDGIAEMTSGEVDALGGLAKVEGSVDLKEELRPLRALWAIEGMRLREILRGRAPEGETPRFAGVVVSYGRATLDARGFSSLRGSGHVDITEGWFGGVKFVGRVLRLIDREYGTAEAKLTSEVRAEYLLRGAAVDLTSIDLRGPVMAARGDGVVWFDGRVDFVVNAGPLERVQDMLGEVGRIFGIVTDQLLKYRVTGTLDEPQLRVLPLGVGARVDRSELP